ncbi:MAG TPA: hypothetical protein VKD19_13215 [Pseudolabrys sp.]|nr:hypothetical protein [Pseudolabrys sp.]
MAKKRKAAAKKASRKPAARKRRRGRSPDTTINTLVILVVIVVVLAGMYLYAQNRKQAALLPMIGHAVATLITPQPTLTPQKLLPAAGAEKPDIAIVLKTTATVDAK